MIEQSEKGEISDNKQFTFHKVRFVKNEFWA